MANLNVECHDGMYQISSQAFSLQCSQTDANKKVLCLFLRALQHPETGKAFFTHEHIAKAFGYKARQNTQNFEQDLKKCGGDLLAYLQHNCKVDQSVIDAVTEVVRQRPLASAPQLCPQVSARLGRTDLTPANIRTALTTVPCTVIRPILQQHWEQGTFHPKEEVVLQEAFAALSSSSSSSPVAEEMAALGLEPIRVKLIPNSRWF